jgi:elongator complex protein 2
VFTAPRCFAESLQNITEIVEEQAIIESRPIGANLPALGLSNKAVFEAQIDRDSYAAAPISSSGLTRPPLEEELLSTTLWPELDKLYCQLILDMATDTKSSK